MADNKKGRFVILEEFYEFLEDVASDFEVSDTSDESEDQDKSLVLLIGIFIGYFTFLEGYILLRKNFSVVKMLVFFCLLFALLEVVIIGIIIFL